jgi:hypothetical protein
MPNNTLNIATPTSNRQSDAKTYAILSSDEPVASCEVNGNMSSPLVRELQSAKMASPVKENISPSKTRHSRILSGAEIAPLRILSPREEDFDTETLSPAKQNVTVKSPRKPIAPERRFPVRINSGPSPEKLSQKSPEKPVVVEHVVEQELTFEDALETHDGLKHAIQIFDEESTILENDEEMDEADVTSMSVHRRHIEVDDDEPAGPDDTMVSTFSTFSAVPNMTMFARIGHSPTRFANMGMTPSTARRRPDPSPLRTPRGPVMQDAAHESDNTTSLMDFTAQLSGFSSARPDDASSPSYRPRQSPAKTTGHRSNETPQRSHPNLLDFDIPPLPTPRSVPTVTAREVETLKSAFLSEISSLKASLLGKEAEVSSLKTAMGDAEKRAGDYMEQLRETKHLREALSEEKESWEKRGREMESVLRRVKAEIVMGQREREDLEYKIDESEKRREAAEMMAQEAESKMAGMRAGKASADANADNRSSDKGSKSPGSREVEIAVERVARELHALYKSKHESKVSALKKSYENRWEKRVRELEDKIEDLTDDNEKLRLGRDATMTKVEPGQAAADEERKAEAVKSSAQIQELNAEIQKLGAIVDSVKQDNQELIQLLEKERVEKGELVSLAEEMMSMQPSFVQQDEAPPPPATSKAAHPFRVSLTRPGISGLRAPGTLTKSNTESRIGGLAHDRKIPTPQGGLPRPGNGLGTRSGIMSSIEKMGSYKGRGNQ